MKKGSNEVPGCDGLMEGGKLDEHILTYHIWPQRTFVRHILSIPPVEAQPLLCRLPYQFLHATCPERRGSAEWNVGDVIGMRQS